MNRRELSDFIRKKKNCLCVGLDSDVSRLPQHFSKTPQRILSFNKAIIDATKDVCIAYKINTAFYESLGSAGWETLEKTVAYLPDTHFKIADAKRGDIGNTSRQYAKAFLQEMPFDALTVAPYMGEDSIKPFLEIEGKWVIILGLTSNKGSADFQKLRIGDEFLWQKVMKTTAQYGSDENIMYVVGATRSEDMTAVRNVVPDHFLLVPGVGAQGGNLDEVMELGLNDDAGLLINASRSVIFADSGKNFAQAAHNAALRYQEKMKPYL